MSEYRAIRLLGWSSGWLAAALLLSACGGDSSPPPMSSSGGGSGGSGGGASGSGGLDGTGGAGATGGGGTGGSSTGALTLGVSNCTGTGTGGAAGAGACDLPTEPIACSGTMIQKPMLVNFSSLTSSGSWGAAAAGDLTGGTSFYQGDCSSVLTLTREAGSDMITITGNLPVMGYAGIVLWFGPCIDASTVMDGPTTGVSMVIGGDLAGGRLKVQPQTSTNYPVDTANSKGECLFTDCDARWSQCAPPTATITSIPATAEAMELTWDKFTDGSPEATKGTDGHGLVGLQLQFECSGSAACPINVQLGTITLTM